MENLAMETIELPRSSEAQAPCMKLAIVYHFFALYRAPILDALNEDPDLQVMFVSDRVNRILPNVPVWTPKAGTSTRQARCYPIIGGVMLQMNIVSLAFDRSLDAVILLGDWKWPSTWLTALFSRVMGKRVIFWSHGWRRQDRGLRRWIRRLFYSLAHGMLLYGNRAKRIGIQNHFNSSSLHVIFNSLDHTNQVCLRGSLMNDSRAKTREEIFGDADTPVIICSCRLDSRKKLGLLLDALGLLRGNGVCINLILIGDGPEKVSLLKTSEALGLPVHFEGACFDESRISVLTSAAAVTVSPGATGLTVIQSLGYGIPVITNDDMDTQGPEVEAIVPGETGEFFRSDDVNSLCEAIKRWTTKPNIDDALRQRCYSIIDKLYNPDYQVSVLKDAVLGHPAVENPV